MEKIEYTKENLEKLCNESFSYRQVLLKAGRNPNGGGAYSNLKKKIQEYDIDVSHFLGKAANSGDNHKGGKRLKYTLEEILVEHSTITQKTLRKYIEKFQVIPYYCVNCGCNGNWQGGVIALELDHINGVNDDNRIENLRYLCPNCHALTDTYCGRNKKKA